MPLLGADQCNSKFSLKQAAELNDNYTVFAVQYCSSVLLVIIKTILMYLYKLYLYIKLPL
jgi:uncharacterized membrane protein